MKKIIWSAFLAFAIVGVPVIPAAHADITEMGEYTWGDKLGRGALNIVGSPVEVARTIHVQSNVEGPAYGWTVGVVQGLGKFVLRLGSGAIEVVTFPFDFPDENKAPLLDPTYPWQKWDVDYL